MFILFPGRITSSCTNGCRNWSYRAFKTADKITQAYSGNYESACRVAGNSCSDNRARQHQGVFASTSYDGGDTAIVNYELHDNNEEIKFAILEPNKGCGWDGSHTEETVYALSIASFQM